VGNGGASGGAGRVGVGNGGASGRSGNGGSGGGGSPGSAGQSGSQACANPTHVLPLNPSNPQDGLTLGGFYVDTDT